MTSRVSAESMRLLTSWFNEASSCNHAPPFDYLGGHCSTFGAAVGEDAMDVRELVTFEGDLTLLRGVPLSTVFSRFGTIWGSAKGCERTYALSREVPALGDFLSHNWCVSRAAKLLTLSWHYNFRSAIVVSLLCVVALACLGYFGLGPTVEVKSSWGPRRRGTMCTVLCTPIFLLALTQCRALRCCGCQERVVFVDKACVNQVDMALQRQSIVKLAAFIAASQRMVVLYTNIYTRKLWTVYEMAAFLTIHSSDRMDILPVFSAQTTTALICFIWVSRIFEMIALLASGVYYVVYGVMFVVGCPGLLQMRKFAREQQAMRASVANFSAQGALCTVESDRQIVFANIVALMRFRGGVLPSATDEEARSQFDLLVQTNLGELLSTSLGELVRYRYALAAGFLAECKYLDKVVGVAYGAPVQEVAANGIFHITWAVVFWPWLCVLFERGASTKLDLPVSWDVLVAIGSMICAILLVIIVNTAYTRLEYWAAMSRAGFIIHVVVSASMAVGTTLYFLRRSRLRLTRRRTVIPHALPVSEVIGGAGFEIFARV